MVVRPTLADHSRKRLLNAILFLVTNTQNCGKTKLLKLLYFLDMEHFRQTGRTVTGQRYEAWEMGPVAREVYRDIDRPPEDLLRHVNVEWDQSPDDPECYRSKLTPVADFDREVFSRRELRIMHEVADKYRCSTATEMSRETHAPGTPWHRVYEQEQSRNGEIPFEYGLEGDPDREAIEELAHEHRDTIKNYA